MDRRNFFSLMAGVSVLPFVPKKAKPADIAITASVTEAPGPQGCPPGHKGEPGPAGKSIGQVTVTVHCDTSEFDKAMQKIEGQLHRAARLRRLVDG